MKKGISLILALVMCLSLCACGGQSGNRGENEATYTIQSNDEATYTIQCNDGKTRTMTAAEIYDMHKNHGRNFEKLLHGATISGTGTIERVGHLEEEIWEDDGVACAWGREIHLKVPGTHVVVSTTFSPKDYYAEMYSGDKVSFTGALRADATTVYIGVHCEMEGHHLTLQ